MDLKTLCRRVYVECAPSVGRPVVYADYDDEVRQTISAFPGLKTNLAGCWNEIDQDTLRLSVVMSDFLSLYLRGIQQHQLIGWGSSATKKPRKVIIDDEILQRFGLLDEAELQDGNATIVCGLMTPNDNHMEDFIASLEPLVNSGRLMIRPVPVISILTKERTNEGGRVFKTYQVDPDSPFEEWVFSGKPYQDSMPLKGGASDSALEVDKAEFLLPFIRGIPFNDLAKLLDDEEHNLSEMRLAIGTLIKRVQRDETNVHEVYNDVLRPAIGKVERRFRQITNMHAVKVGGAVVATVGLTLASLTHQGLVASLSPLVGTGGAFAIAKEYADYMKANADLTDMPYYLLWRMSKMSKP
jgi:hypothetical protein